MDSNNPGVPAPRTQLLTTNEAAAYLRFGPQKVRNMVRDGELPAVRISSKRIRFRVSDLDAYIQSKVV